MRLKSFLKTSRVLSMNFPIFIKVEGRVDFSKGAQRWLLGSFKNDMEVANRDE